jgi:hypothetical protein
MLGVIMEDKTILRYSFGKDRFDNKPSQYAVESFDAFKRHILGTRSPSKGMNFFCSAFQSGEHNDPHKYPGAYNFRLKKLALPRRFIALDFDGFLTVAAYEDTFEFLQRYSGFGYETWSHTSSNPRARAVLELSREVSAKECAALCHFIEAEIREVVGVGQISFDKSVYQLEQPVYGPPINARIFDFNGAVINVDDFIGVAVEEFDNSLGWLKNRPSHIEQIDLTKSLTGKMVPPDETPRQIMILMNMLTHISADCEYEVYRRVIWAILSTGWDCAEEIAYDWSMTVPDRFEREALDDLIRGFNAELLNCPSYGTIKYLARQGGWDGQ